MKILKTVLLFLSMLSVYANAQEIQLNSVSISGFSKDKITKVIKLVSKNTSKVKSNFSRSNYRINESLYIDNLYSIDTSYIDRFFYATKQAWGRGKSSNFLGKYLDFELSRPIFVYFLNDVSYTFSKNLFISDTDSYNYNMIDLDSLYSISFESKTIEGHLLVKKSTMMPLSITQKIKKGIMRNRSFANYDNKYRLNVEYLINKYILHIEYKDDTNGVLCIKKIDKEVDLNNYNITRRDKKNQKILLNDILKTVKSKVKAIKI